MKVRINITVEVDVDSYCRDYGVDPNDKAELREDVRRYVVGGVDEMTPSIRVTRG